MNGKNTSTNSPRGNGSMRELLGGKGANLAEMSNLGMPVPQGFTVTTEACTQYYNDGAPSRRYPGRDHGAPGQAGGEDRQSSSAIPPTPCWSPSAPAPGPPCPA